MERNEQLKGHKQKQCWSENYKVEDVSSCRGFHWSRDLGEPSVGSVSPSGKGESFWGRGGVALFPW